MNMQVGTSGVQVRTNESTRTDATAGTTTQAGAGVNGTDTTTAPEANGSLTMSLSNAMRQFAPNSSKDFEVILAQVSQKMKDVSSDTQTERVIANQEVQQLNAEENQAKVNDSIEKAEKAAAKRKDGDLWAKISEVASYVGAALLAAAGAAVIILSAGALAPLGGLMIASAVVTTLGLIDAQVQKDNGGMGMFALAVDAVVPGGLNDKEVMALNIASAAINAAASIALGIATGNVAAASSAITAIKALAVAIDIGTTLVTSTADVGANVTRMEAAELQKDSEDLKSDGLEIQAANSALDDVVDQALKMLMAAAEAFNAMIDSVVTMMNDKGKSMERTQFVG